MFDWEERPGPEPATAAALIPIDDLMIKVCYVSLPEAGLRENNYRFFVDNAVHGGRLRQARPDNPATGAERRSGGVTKGSSALRNPHYVGECAMGPVTIAILWTGWGNLIQLYQPDRTPLPISRVNTGRLLKRRGQPTGTFASSEWHVNRSELPTRGLRGSL